MRRWSPLLLACLLLAGCARVGGDGAQWSHNSVLPLDADATVGQSFTVASPELVGVDVTVATFAQPADPNGQLRGTLVDAETRAVLAEAVASGSVLRDNSWAPLRFHPPVPITGPVAVELTWHGSTPLAVLANTPRTPGDADVLVNDPYPYGQLLLDGEPAVGDLTFRVVGSNGPEVLPATLAGLVRGALGGLARQPWFAALWVALLVGCGALAGYGLLDHRRRRAGDDLPERGRHQEERHGAERGAD